jgi:LmbE family N-acetylglucosaminyl deacetylase
MGTLVSFHAHPDDEVLLTGGTLASAATEGHRVVLVVATRGEVGDADPTVLADTGDLGAHREAELARSAEILGIDRVVLLGYRDSGHGPDHTPGDGTFVGADPSEAADRLAEVLADERADVLTTYDPAGGYGHPDHIRVHTVGALAAERAGVPTVLEATFDRSLLRAAVDLAPSLGFDLPEGLLAPDPARWFVDPAEITHRIDVRPQLDRKRAAMAAHASQTTSATAGLRSLAVFLALPDELFALAFGTEFFVDRTRPPGPPATSLFPDRPASPS